MGKEEHYLKKELHECFKKDSSLFEFLQLGSLDGVWYWDIENPVNEWMSPQFWSLLGYDPEEKKHLSSEWQDIINQDDLTVALENFKQHCEDPNHPYDQVVRYRHKDGSTVWVRCRGIAVRDKGGCAIRMLGAHNDITELKLKENELLIKTKELEKANKKLEEANKKLEDTISGILPICSACKKIRDDKGYWNQIETYICTHTDAKLSHSVCPDCFKKLYPGYTYHD